jgi:hypothetical protein
MPRRGTGLGSVHSAISRFVREGANRVTGLRAFREAGGRIATETWNRLWGFVRRHISQRAQVAASDPTVPVRDFRIGEWAAGRPGQWAIQVDVVMQHPELGSFVRQYTMISDRLVSPAAAVDEAIGTYQDQIDLAEPGTEYADQTIVGAVVTGVFRMTGAPE